MTTILTDILLAPNQGHPEPGALAYDRTGIIALGDPDRVKAQVGPAQEIALPGALVCPGLIDTHCHFLEGALTLSRVDLRQAASREEFRQILATYLKANPGQGWVLGGFWDEATWGGPLPDKTWLDDLTPDRPVFLARYDLHSALANSKALALAGITTQTPDPFDGRIARDAEGQVSGLLVNQAVDLFREVIPTPSEADKIAALAKAVDYAHSLGLTGAQTMPHSLADLSAHRRVFAEPIGLSLHIRPPLAELDQVLAVDTADWPERMILDGVKGWTDGTLGSRTAWFRKPYLGTTETGGPWLEDMAGFAESIRRAAAAGLSVLLHAIGDKAVEWNLDVFYQCIDQGLGSAPLRIEHFQHPRQQDIERMKHPRLIAALQPYHLYGDAAPAEDYLGSRADRSFPIKSLMDQGSDFVFGSDWPVVSLNPLTGLQTAVTRQDATGRFPNGWLPNEKITSVQALGGYTWRAAKAVGRENKYGSLKPGQAADLAVFDRDFLSGPPEEITKAKCIMTVIGGQTVFKAA